MKWKELETFWKNRYDELDKIFYKQLNNPKSTTQTTSETKPTSTNTPSIGRSQHNRLLTSTHLYEPKEIKDIADQSKPKQSHKRS